jgi:hypothetical protein
MSRKQRREVFRQLRPADRAALKQDLAEYRRLRELERG